MFKNPLSDDNNNNRDDSFFPSWTPLFSLCYPYYYYFFFCMLMVCKHLFVNFMDWKKCLGFFSKKYN